MIQTKMLQKNKGVKTMFPNKSTSLKTGFSQFVFRNQRGIATISSLIAGIIISCIVLAIMGYNPIDIITFLFQGSFSTAEFTWQTIQTWSLFVLLGISVAFGFKAGLFNIGVAGQMVFSATMGYLFVYSHQNMNPGVLVAIVVLIAIASSVLFGFIAGTLKAIFGVHEVITTIMLNWVAVKLIKGFIGQGKIPSARSQITKLPTGVSTTMDSISPYITWALFAAIVAVILMFILFKYTKIGMKIKIVGNNIHAGKYAGYKAKSIIIGVMIISALIAGIAGVTYYFGQFGVAGRQISVGSFEVPPLIGFTGIAIALTALNNPFAIVPVALLFATTQGDTALNGLNGQNYYVPREVGELFGSIIVYFVAISNLFIYILTPRKIKLFVIRVLTYIKNNEITLSTKTITIIANIFTLGIYTYAINNWEWINKIFKKKSPLSTNDVIKEGA